MHNALPSSRDEPLAGDPSLERLLEDQRMPLTRFAARLIGDADRARDVVQDTFVRFLARPAGEIDGYAVEWLFTVCRLYLAP